MGPFLGLGPEREWGADYRAVERFGSARALGRVGKGTRFDEPRHRGQHRHELVVVWCEHARDWPALVRFHGPGILVSDALCGTERRPDWAGIAPATVLAQLPHCHRQAALGR